MFGIHLKKKLIILIILLISRIVYSWKNEDDEYEYKYENEDDEYEYEYENEYQHQYEDHYHYIMYQPIFLTSTNIIIDPTITNVVTTLELMTTDMSTTMVIDPTITNVITTLELITTAISTIKETFTIQQCPVGSSFFCGNTNKCVDLSTDLNNCGLCDNVCHFANAVPRCSNSQCDIQLCYPGFSNCNTNILDGCEVNIQTDEENCGACSNICDETQVCLNGVCSMPCSAVGGCAAINFENVGCVSTESIGTGISEEPYTQFVPGSISITAIQCYNTCINHFAQALKFFTLSVDTTTAGSLIRTFCSCYTDSNNVGFQQIPATTCNNNYGETTNGVGSWYLYSVI